MRPLSKPKSNRPLKAAVRPDPASAKVKPLFLALGLVILIESQWAFVIMSFSPYFRPLLAVSVGTMGAFGVSVAIFLGYPFASPTVMRILKFVGAIIVGVVSTVVGGLILQALQ